MSVISKQSTQKKRTVFTYPDAENMVLKLLTYLLLRRYDGLFEDSVGYFEGAGYTIRNLTRDLHNSDIKDNIVTEHEKMFTDEGIKIKYLEACV